MRTKRFTEVYSFVQPNRRCIEIFEIHSISCFLFTARSLWSTEVILIGQSPLFKATCVFILLSNG
jgi:S-ribosylhomocysteine lyase LuxS involved in autoinducer biosynthesis